MMYRYNHTVTININVRTYQLAEGFLSALILKMDHFFATLYVRG